MQPSKAIPTCEIDFWSDAVILDPYPHYDRLRALGPAVWLARNDVWALTRYESVRGALLSPRSSPRPAAA